MAASACIPPPPGMDIATSAAAHESEHPAGQTRVARQIEGIGHRRQGNPAVQDHLVDVPRHIARGQETEGGRDEGPPGGGVGMVGPNTDSYGRRSRRYEQVVQAWPALVGRVSRNRRR